MTSNCLKTFTVLNAMIQTQDNSFWFGTIQLTDSAHPNWRIPVRTEDIAL